MKRYLLYGLAILILVSVIISVISSIKNKDKKGKYLEFKVRRGEVRETISATGEIKAATGAQISLGARVTGTVVKEPISVGDYVNKGDLIAIIDNRELKEGVKKAKAELARVIVHYENLIKEKELEISELAERYENSLLEVEKAVSEFDFRKWNFQSMKRLFQSRNHSVSERTYREAKNILKKAKEGLKQARNSKEASHSALNRAKTALNRLKQEFEQERIKAQAELEKALIRMSYSELRAPFSGVITYVSTQEGETVVAGLNAPQFVKILDESKVENWIYVDETDIGKVDEGMHVTFQVDAYPDIKFNGKIHKIYPAPIVQNNVVYYIAVVKIIQKATRLHLKMTTHNTIHIKTIKDTLIVPNGAVKFMDGHFVVKVKGGKGDGYVKVVTGVSDSEFTQIIKGLAEGDIVLYRP